MSNSRPNLSPKGGGRAGASPEGSHATTSAVGRHRRRFSGSSHTHPIGIQPQPQPPPPPPSLPSINALMNENSYASFGPRPNLDFERTRIYRGRSEEMRYPSATGFNVAPPYAEPQAPFPPTNPPAPLSSGHPLARLPSWQGSAAPPDAIYGRRPDPPWHADPRVIQRAAIHPEDGNLSPSRSSKRPRTLPEPDGYPNDRHRTHVDRAPGPSTVTKVSDLLATPRSPRLSSAGGHSSDMGTSSGVAQPMSKKEERKLRRMYQACVRCRRKKLKVSPQKMRLFVELNSATPPVRRRPSSMLSMRSIRLDM